MEQMGKSPFFMWKSGRRNRPRQWQFEVSDAVNLDTLKMMRAALAF